MMRSRSPSRSRSRSSTGYRRSESTDSAYCSGDEDQSTYKGDIKTLYYIVTDEDGQKYRKPSRNEEGRGQARSLSRESVRSRDRRRSTSRSSVGYRRRSESTDSVYCSGDEDQSTYKGDIKTLYYIVTDEDDNQYGKLSQASARSPWPSSISPDSRKQEVENRKSSEWANKQSREGHKVNRNYSDLRSRKRTRSSSPIRGIMPADKPTGKKRENTWREAKRRHLEGSEEGASSNKTSSFPCKKTETDFQQKMRKRQRSPSTGRTYEEAKHARGQCKKKQKREKESHCAICPPVLITTTDHNKDIAKQGSTECLNILDAMDAKDSHCKFTSAGFSSTERVIFSTNVFIRGKKKNSIRLCYKQKYPSSAFYAMSSGIFSA